MNKDEILNLLDEAALSEVEVLQEEDNLLLVHFYYDYDETELSAAKAYADFEKDTEEGDGSLDELSEVPLAVEELKEEEERLVEDEEAFDPEKDYKDAPGEDEDNPVNYSDPKLNYLSDIAVEEVGEILEEISEELDLDVQYVGYDLMEDLIADEGEEDPESYEFVALFYEKGQDLDIDDFLDVDMEEVEEI